MRVPRRLRGAMRYYNTRCMTQWLDRTAVSLSGLCLVHCLIGTLVLSAAAVTGGLWSHDVHAIGFALAVPLAAVALSRGVLRHRRFEVAGLGAAGLGLMLGSLTAAHGSPSELAVSMAGVALLGLAHYLNLRWSRG